MADARPTARPGSPASASSPASARGRTRIGRRSAPASRRPIRTIFAPYIIHRSQPLDFDKQIPKKGDQRQMEPWQRIGTYAAGLALDSAGIKGNADILARTDMIVAAGGGERDVAADTAILSGLPHGRKARSLPQRTADERPAPDAVPRPALQPARRQHLDRARRDRIVAHLHGRGSRRASTRCASRMRASLRARATLRWSAARYNAERPDLLMLYEFGGFGLKDKFAPVWEREAKPRLCARLARRIPGDRIPRACRSARRQSARAADRRACPTGRSRNPGDVTASARRAVEQDRGRPSTPARPR